MKTLFVWIFLIYISFVNVSLKSDEIENYEIEGISIGDSLLKIYKKNYINKKSSDIKYGKKKFSDYQKIYKDKNNKLYDRIVLYYKHDDINYFIKQISGRKYFKKNIGECYKLQNKISKDLESSLTNSEKIETDIIRNSSYPNGDSYKKEIVFYLQNNSLIRLVCYDYSKKDTRSKDRLSVIFSTAEYNIWLSNSLN